MFDRRCDRSRLRSHCRPAAPIWNRADPSPETPSSTDTAKAGARRWLAISQIDGGPVAFVHSAGLEPARDFDPRAGQSGQGEGNHDCDEQARWPRRAVRLRRGSAQASKKAIPAPATWPPRAWSSLDPCDEIGMRMLPSTESSSSPLVTPRICASGRKASRCSRTGGARFLTSSGVT